MIALTTSCAHKISDPDYNRQFNMVQELSYLFSEPPCKNRLTLDDVIELVVSRNLDIIVKEQEIAIQCETATSAMLKMLPALRLNAEYYNRNNNTGSSSFSLDPKVPPAPPSVSLDSSWRKNDESDVWNVLDFGLAYYRSRQETNRAVILSMEYERAEQNLILEATRAYWKAIGAKRAMDKAGEIMKAANQQKQDIDKQMNAKVIPEIQGLRNQNQLITINLQLQSYEKDYHTAMADLARLMAFPPCCSFELEEPTSLTTDVPICDICLLEEQALKNRPELYGKDAEEFIWADEARMALLQMLPGAELYNGRYDDSNSFLVNQSWLAIGIRATWNLLAIPQLLHAKKAAEERTDLMFLNRLALSIGVMTQVHLAWFVFTDNREQFLMAYDLWQVNERLLRTARKEEEAGKLHEADILRYEAETLISEINAMRAYGEMQASLELLNNSIGAPRWYQTGVVSGPPPVGQCTIPLYECDGCYPIIDIETEYTRRTRVPLPPQEHPFSEFKAEYPEEMQIQPYPELYDY